MKKRIRRKADFFSAPIVKPLCFFCAAVFFICPFRFMQGTALAVILAVIFCRLYTKTLYKSITVERSETFLRAACGDKLKITLTVKNYSRLPLLFCLVQDNFGSLRCFEKVSADAESGDFPASTDGKPADGLPAEDAAPEKKSGAEKKTYFLNGRFMFSLRPREVKPLEFFVYGTSRGLYLMGPVIVKAGDPFSLFSFKKQIELPCKVMIYPMPAKYNPFFKPGIPQGSLSILNPVYEDVTMYKAVRPYQSGDELKRINWHASAKFNSLFTNEYQDTYDVPVFIYLNLALDDYPLEQRYDYGETAVEIAAALVEKASRLKQKCGFAAFGTGFPYLAPAGNQAGTVLDILATIKMEAGSAKESVNYTLKKLPSTVKTYVIDYDFICRFRGGSL